jgi:hypothetical protein
VALIASLSLAANSDVAPWALVAAAVMLATIAAGLGAGLCAAWMRTSARRYLSGLLGRRLIPRRFLARQVLSLVATPIPRRHR